MDLRVPPSVRNGSRSALLDCEYTLKPTEIAGDSFSGLVVKGTSTTFRARCTSGSWDRSRRTWAFSRADWIWVTALQTMVPPCTGHSTSQTPRPNSWENTSASCLPSTARISWLKWWSSSVRHSHFNYTFQHLLYYSFFSHSSTL